MSTAAAVEKLAEALPRICFIHIPKTAGLSVRTFFSSLYGALAFPGYTTVDYRVADDATLARYRFFAGHSFHRDWSRLGPNIARFTILRDPVARVVSLYRYWNEIDFSHLVNRSDSRFTIEAIEIARSEPIETFVTSESPFIRQQIRGCYARQLLHEEALIGWNRASNPRPAIFAEAIERLFALDAVLTTERLDTGFPRLLRRLGLPWIGARLDSVNVSATPVAVDEDRLRDILFRISPLDFHIYDVARQLEAGLR